jgi:hypothetical protein
MNKLNIIEYLICLLKYFLNIYDFFYSIIIYLNIYQYKTKLMKLFTNLTKNIIYQFARQTKRIKN